MSEDDISNVMHSVWQAVGNGTADAKDEVIFELYRQRDKYRNGLDRIAAYPYKGWSQQLAEKTLASVHQVAGKITPLNRTVETAVNRGIAAAALDDLPAGAEVMCKEGVPLEVSKRVLLDPASRRASDWHAPEEILSIHPRQSRTG